MVVDFSKTPSVFPPISIDGQHLERVSEFKLLGVWISQALTWEKHVSELTKKASQRLYFLRLLKRSGLRTNDLRMYYVSVIRPVLEFASEVWHPGLTKEQCGLIERCQRRALNIICPDLDYQEANMSILNLTTLETRRMETCKRLFHQIVNGHHKLSRLLPVRRVSAYNTRHFRNYPVPTIRNNRYKSDFITYSLLYNQWLLKQTVILWWFLFLHILIWFHFSYHDISDFTLYMSIFWLQILNKL